MTHPLGRGVPVPLAVCDGVKLGDGDEVIVSEADALDVGVLLRVDVGVPVFVGVCDGVAPTDSVADAVAVLL